MNFFVVAMEAQRLDVGISLLEIGDFFTGEVSWKATLPELMLPFDFSLGLRSGGVAQADVVKLECGAQLGERVGFMREENAVVIDVELQWPAIGQKGGGQEIKVGEQQLAFVELGTSEQAAAIIEHVEHGEGNFALWEPSMG